MLTAIDWVHWTTEKVERKDERKDGRSKVFVCPYASIDRSFLLHLSLSSGYEVAAVLRVYVESVLTALSSGAADVRGSPPVTLMVRMKLKTLTNLQSSRVVKILLPSVLRDNRKCSHRDTYHSGPRPRKPIFPLHVLASAPHEPLE